MTNADEQPEEVLARLAHDLAEGIEQHLAGWVVRCVELRAHQWGGDLPAGWRQAALRAGEAARAEMAPRVAGALATDVDAGGPSPLSLLREAVSYPTMVLAELGVPHVVRDEVDVRMFPDDVYGLAPANFADIHPSLHDPAIAWGAARAFVHLDRRRNPRRS